MEGVSNGTAEGWSDGGTTGVAFSFLPLLWTEGAITMGDEVGNVGVGMRVAIAPSFTGIALIPLATDVLGEVVAVVGTYSIGFPGPTGGGTDNGAAVGPH